MKIKHDVDYRPVRAKAYPDTPDALDAIFKAIAALRDQGIVLPADTLSWLAACEAVKDRYPKPKGKA